jgi:hypothetical protein
MNYKQHDPLTHRYPRTLDEAFDERGPLIEMGAKPSMSTALKYVAAVWLVLSIVIGYEMTGMAFQKGFEQGYAEGRESALMEQGTTAEQCYRWWFGENKKQFEHEMKQFCKRSDV